MFRTILKGLCFGALCFPLMGHAFTDTDGYVYQDAIIFLQSREIVKGYPDGSYGVDRTISRAELLKIVLEATQPGVRGTGENCFPDIDSEDWFSTYVCYAKEHTIIKGYPDGTFKPDQSVTAAEALKITLGVFEKGVTEGEGRLWYQPYLDRVHEKNVFSKYALNPENGFTRGQMAHLIHLLLLDREGTKVFGESRQHLSAGCGLTPPESAPTNSLVDGLRRNYLTTIGRKYDKNTPMPLILAFHGRTNSNSMVRQYYKLDRVTNGEAIIVYPLGLPEEGPSRSRMSPGDKSSDLRDFQLFDQLVKEFSEAYCIDMDQIYVVGHSLGARFTNTLACARGDVIRAIGSVGGGTTKNTCTGPVAALIMQHPDDNLSSYTAGVSARDQLLQQNSCGPEKRSVGPSRGGCVEYTNCLTDAPVIWCEHNDDIDHRGVYYPHKWPDGAGQYIRDFFMSLNEK